MMSKEPKGLRAPAASHVACPVTVLTATHLQAAASAAPLWSCILSFDTRCQDPPSQTLLTSTQLATYYDSGQVGASTLVAGLELAVAEHALSGSGGSDGATPRGVDIPIQFFRPLEAVMEFVDLGTYTPVTATMAADGPPHAWCPPLHMEIQRLDEVAVRRQQHQQHQPMLLAAASTAGNGGGGTCSAAQPASMMEAPAAQPAASEAQRLPDRGQQQGLGEAAAALAAADAKLKAGRPNTPPGSKGPMLEDVEAILGWNCNSWSLVHHYHGDLSKCESSLKNEDIVQGLLNSTLSINTPVVGLQLGKDKPRAWVRPACFVPLAALLCMQQQGVVYTGVTRPEVDRVNRGGAGVCGALMAAQLQLQPVRQPFTPPQPRPAPPPSGNYASASAPLTASGRGLPGADRCLAQPLGCLIATSQQLHMAYSAPPPPPSPRARQHIIPPHAHPLSDPALVAANPALSGAAPTGSKGPQPCAMPRHPPPPPPMPAAGRQWSPAVPPGTHSSAASAGHANITRAARAPRRAARAPDALDMLLESLGAPSIGPVSLEAAVDGAAVGSCAAAPPFMQPPGPAGGCVDSSSPGGGAGLHSSSPAAELQALLAWMDLWQQQGLAFGGPPAALGSSGSHTSGIDSGTFMQQVQQVQQLMVGAQPRDADVGVAAASATSYATGHDLDPIRWLPALAAVQPSDSGRLGSPPSAPVPASWPSPTPPPCRPLHAGQQGLARAHLGRPSMPCTGSGGTAYAFPSSAGVLPSPGRRLPTKPQQGPGMLPAAGQGACVAAASHDGFLHLHLNQLVMSSHAFSPLGRHAHPSHDHHDALSGLQAALQTQASLDIGSATLGAVDALQLAAALAACPGQPSQNAGHNAGGGGLPPHVLLDALAQLGLRDPMAYWQGYPTTHSFPAPPGNPPCGK